MPDLVGDDLTTSADASSKRRLMDPVRLFYALKPIIPRSVQMTLRRIRARRIWRDIGYDCRPRLGAAHTSFPWPSGQRAAALITHDVEHAAGQANISSLRSIEDRLSLRSCWNFPTSRYVVDEALIADLIADGHEVGIHGVLHDGKLFASQKIFHHRLVEILAAAERWGSRGFRSPSLLYDTDLLAELPLAWDSSQPAWDPFQPQPGGCGRYVPFRLPNGCVELPVTLWQDFTLFEELQCQDTNIWRVQIDELHKAGALINLIVHPDYMLTPTRIGHFRDVLEHLQTKSGLWITLPSEIVRWVSTANL